jgi:hypothetical protein
MLSSTDDFKALDTPSASDLKRYADLDLKIAERRAMGVVNGRSWSGILLEHDSDCLGTCCVPVVAAAPTTPFGRLFGLAYEQDVKDFANKSWWAMYGDELMVLEEKASADYRANRVAIDAVANARAAAADARLKAERVAIRVGAMCTKRKSAIAKVAQPCKFLYNCQGTPARPTTMSVTTECWSHEYTDPVTGAKVAKHVCDRMHPGEEGWLRQWDTDRNFRVAAPAVRVWNERSERQRGRW